MEQRPLEQKTIGVLGGCSHVATGEYYKFLNGEANARIGGWDIAETIIAGMNFGNIAAFVRKNDWRSLELYMEKKVEALLRAGADVIICVSNTLHKPLEPIISRQRAPFIHIVDPTGEALRKRDLSRVALFGTQPVMELDYLQKRYRTQYGVETVVPNNKEREDIHQIIFSELVKNSMRQASKERYLEILDRLVEEEGVEGLILGCTEIFLLIDQDDRPHLPMFNTAKLHCDAAVDFALKAATRSP